MTIDRSLRHWTAPVLVALTLWLGACASSGKVSVKSGASSSASSEEAGQAGPSVVINYEEPEIEEPIEVIELDESVESDGVDDRESEERVAATEEPTPEELLQESLEAYQSSEVFWERGDFDDALAALDRSYQLMADVPPNGDALVAQEKEDLRRLISRRIVEVYASRQTTVGDMSLEIPRVMNEYVEREIKSFQGPERDFFVESYQRSGFYRPMIIRELREAGLPEEISWLPLVESGFKSRAMSRARALGLWQFISSTGYRYGLERDWWIDERLDPEKATLGAIGYLTDLHNLFGDWLTAMAAYNCGEHNVLRRINSQRVSYFDQFWDIYTRLPRETRRYVPRFLAVVIIMDDPGAYGFDLPEPFPPLEWESTEIERSAELQGLDTVMGLEPGTLELLNPELRRKATPGDPYDLKVPSGKTNVLLASLDDLPEFHAPANSFSVHRVRSGETLSGIASRYGTSVAVLMDLNRLRSANRIWPGQQLQVPDGRPGASRTASSQALAPGTELTYSVRRGDSLWIIANRYGTTVDRIKRDNGIRSDTLQPGQRLTIRAASDGGSGAAGSTVYLVRRGDTLGKIAQTQGVSLSRLLQVNGLSRRSTIYPGQRLAIPN